MEHTSCKKISKYVHCLISLLCSFLFDQVAFCFFFYLFIYFILFFFLNIFLNKHLFYELKHTSISNFAALVTHKISRHSYPHALLILPHNFGIFPFFFGCIDGLHCYDCNTYAK